MFKKISRLFTSFFHSEAAGGILLFLCALLAMIVANSRFSHYYFELWELPFGFKIGEHFIGMSFHHWLNDVFMSIFFLIVGLEIKREFLFGELVGFKKAAFPVLAALGGMIAPGIIYFSLNVGTPSQSGFGIPMATDIAFALGVMMLLGKRVPVALKVFLVTLAVADDLGAIIVIGVFYTSDFSVTWFITSVILLGILIALNKLDIRFLSPYLIIGVFLWLAVHNTGIHATIAAVALAFTIPIRPKLNGNDFASKVSSDFIPLFMNKDKERENILLHQDQLNILSSIIKGSKNVQNPLLRLEHTLAPWSNFLIMPLFGFANAGVAISNEIRFDIDHIMLGIILGLVIGKPIGILVFTFLCDKLKIAQKPESVSWINILGAGMLAGIGFTMSIFVSNLAFSNPLSTDLSKLSILIGSSLAGILGSLFLIIEYKIEHRNKS
ncbi:sodium/proton antiporter NhaA [Helicobacter sp. MIT 14-3879]|uniref:sodium/proton antiporter NhaA n=1 Tax=Helicobacter sp. MIT 14-3879 TaxID=2040649 RepID=UPI000E1F7892|nr:sodium/proton antiporter NhaA [Helicobacter sp. MIT 14-3879]RDU65442.1 Na(+)/H(+) antiporter NhaA [Helicobacter sp. MIT 14-3879]